MLGYLFYSFFFSTSGFWRFGLDVWTSGYPKKILGMDSMDRGVDRSG